MWEPLSLNCVRLLSLLVLSLLVSVLFYSFLVNFFLMPSCPGVQATAQYLWRMVKGRAKLLTSCVLCRPQELTPRTHCLSLCSDMSLLCSESLTAGEARRRHGVSGKASWPVGYMGWLFRSVVFSSPSCSQQCLRLLGSDVSSRFYIVINC